MHNQPETAKEASHDERREVTGVRALVRALERARDKYADEELSCLCCSEQRAMATNALAAFRAAPPMTEDDALLDIVADIIHGGQASKGPGVLAADILAALDRVVRE